MSLPENSDLTRILQYVSGNPSLSYLKRREYWLERDLFTLGSLVFNIETAVKRGFRLGRVRIPLSRESLVRIDKAALEREIEDLLVGVLLDDISINITSAPVPFSRGAEPPSLPNAAAVCLFSGGVDSYAGFLAASGEFGGLTASAVIHGDQPWGAHIVDRVVAHLRRATAVDLNKLYAPKMTATGYSQLRGFLYCLFGAATMQLVHADTLLVTEVGPTMYQPRFSPFDSVTMTTHPFVLSKVNRVLGILCGRQVKILLPFENMTKAEVVATSGDPAGLPLTHSCISLRFGRSEGSCYGCVVRRLGFLVAGVQDTPYDTDPIRRGGNGRPDNLLSLARFSLDLLTDYGHMLASSKENIEMFGKRDLFRRFALDTFAALKVYRDEVGPTHRALDRLYDAAVARVPEERLDRRIDKVRRRTFRPNFAKQVGAV